MKRFIKCVKKTAELWPLLERGHTIPRKKKKHLLRAGLLTCRIKRFVLVKGWKRGENRRKEQQKEQW